MPVVCVGNFTVGGAGKTPTVIALVRHLQARGWIPAGGEDNRVVFVRRRDGGGCDGFQMLAFADETRVQAPGAPAWLAFSLLKRCCVILLCKLTTLRKGS